MTSVFDNNDDDDDDIEIVGEKKIVGIRNGDSNSSYCKLVDLVNLNLSNVNLDYFKLEQFCKVIGNCPRISSINLNGNGLLGTDGAMLVFNLAKNNSNINHLHMKNCNIERDVIEPMLVTLQESIMGLVTVDLRDNLHMKKFPNNYNKIFMAHITLDQILLSGSVFDLQQMNGIAIMQRKEVRNKVQPLPENIVVDLKGEFYPLGVGNGYHWHDRVNDICMTNTIIMGSSIIQLKASVYYSIDNKYGYTIDFDGKVMQQYNFAFFNLHFKDLGVRPQSINLIVIRNIEMTHDTKTLIESISKFKNIEKLSIENTNFGHDLTGISSSRLNNDRAIIYKKLKLINKN